LPDLPGGELTDIVHLGAADAPLFRDLDFRDPWGMEREDTLDPDAIGDFSHRKRRAEPASPPADDDSLKLLDTLLIPLDDPDMDVDRIPGAKRLEVRFHLCGFYELEFIHRGSP